MPWALPSLLVSARESTDGRDAVFSTSGRTITFPGFLRAYVQGSDDPGSDPDDKEKVLPKLAPGDALAVQRLEPTGHETLSTGPVYRGLVGATTRGAGSGSALDLCLDHDHDPGPRLPREALDISTVTL